MEKNLKAFLDMIAWSEGTAAIPGSDGGYMVMVGSTPSHPVLFHSYSDHPRTLNSRLNSTAAGRYQIIARNFDVYKRTLNLPDFGPDSQDKIALQLIKECKATQTVLDGDIETAIFQCRSRWASFTGAGATLPDGRPQHTHKIEDLLNAYKNAGGTLAP